MGCNCEKCGGKITGLAHIGIMVKDMDVSKSFYVDKLGFIVTREIALGDLKLCFLNIGSCLLELVCSPNHTPRTAGVVDHICMEVEDIDTIVCKLIEKQIPFESNEVSYNEVLGAKNIFFRGPDDERIEFFDYMKK